MPNIKFDTGVIYFIARYKGNISNPIVYIQRFEKIDAGWAYLGSSYDYGKTWQSPSTSDTPMIVPEDYMKSSGFEKKITTDASMALLLFAREQSEFNSTLLETAGKTSALINHILSKISNSGDQL